MRPTKCFPDGVIVIHTMAKYAKTVEKGKFWPCWPGSTKRRVTIVKSNYEFLTTKIGIVFPKVGRHGSKLIFDKTDFDDFPVRVFLYFFPQQRI